MIPIAVATAACREQAVDVPRAQVSGCPAEYPKSAGRVTDAAGVLPLPAQIRLEQQLSNIERTTAHQVAVVTVPTLGGKDVALVARCLGDRWGIGRKGVNDGIVLLVAPDERKARIAVGDGLRRELTDAEASAIMEAALVPAFRQNDFGGGVTAGVTRIGHEIGMPR